MKLSKDRILVHEVEAPAVETDYVYKGKIILLNDSQTDFRKNMDRHMDIGNKLKTCLVEVKVSSWPGISAGDVVVVHHNSREYATARGLTLGDDFIMLRADDSVYCKESGDAPEALGSYILLDPVPETLEENTVSGIVLKSELSDKTNRGKVRSIGPDFPDMGIEVGDVVLFSGKAHIGVNYKGHTYWRIQERHVLGLCDPLTDEELKRMNDERGKTNAEWREIHADIEWALAQKREKNRDMEARNRVRKFRGKSAPTFTVPGTEI